MVNLFVSENFLLSWTLFLLLPLSFVNFPNITKQSINLFSHCTKSRGHILLLLFIMTILVNPSSSLKYSAESKNFYNSFIKISNKNENFNSYKVPQILQRFHNPSYSDLSIMDLIIHEEQEYIFVVNNNSTVLQLNMNDLSLIKEYRNEHCDTTRPCEKELKINFLSNMYRYGYYSFFFCYIQIHSMLSSPKTICFLPKNHVFDKQITWSMNRYASVNPNYITTSILTEKYSFTGSFLDDSLKIIRRNLPSYMEKKDYHNDIETPMAPFYFEENSHFIYSFQTEYEVYFLVVESVDSRFTGSLFDCHRTTSNGATNPFNDNNKINAIKTEVTRVIRICKDDPGSPTDFQIRHFGTIAKTDLLCYVGEGSSKFFYTKAISASWSNNKLFVLFGSQKNGPTASILCVYDIGSIKQAFDGPTRHQWTGSDCNSYNQKEKPNSLPSVCERLSTKSLTSTEIMRASLLASNGLYRSRDIWPETRQPLLKLPHINYKKLKVVEQNTNNNNNIKMVLLYNDKKIQIFTYQKNINNRSLKSNDLYYLFMFTPSNQDRIKDVGLKFMSQPNESIWLFVTKTKELVKIRIDNCEFYETETKCHNRAPPFCIWHEGNCLLSTTQKSKYRYEKIIEPPLEQLDKLKFFEEQKCDINEGPLSLSCKCGLENNEKGRRSIIKIRNCEGSLKVAEWNSWTNWSDCSINGVRKRIRKCSERNCDGVKEQLEICPTPRNKLFKKSISEWTNWHIDKNFKIHHKYRAVCDVNRTLRARLETKQKFCQGRCSEFSQNWSVWSNCFVSKFRYRLFNCSSIGTCSPTQIQITLCGFNENISETEPKNVKALKSLSTIGYSFIQLVLAILITSIVWLILLISLFLKFMPHLQKKYNNNHNNQHHHHHHYLHSLNSRQISKGKMSQPLFTNDNNNNNHLNGYPSNSIPKVVSNEYISYNQQFKTSSSPISKESPTFV